MSKINEIIKMPKIFDLFYIILFTMDKILGIFFFSIFIIN